MPCLETEETFTRDGKPVAAPILLRADPTPEQADMLLECAANPNWGEFSYGSTFTFAGPRLYARTVTHLMGVGPRP